MVTFNRLGAFALLFCISIQAETNELTTPIKTLRKEGETKAQMMKRIFENEKRMAIGGKRRHAQALQKAAVQQNAHAENLSSKHTKCSCCKKKQ